MCICFFVLNPIKGVRLMLSFNRDENNDRETLPLAYWKDINENVLGGFDIDSQGSWMAFNTSTFNFSFLTNYDDCEFKDITNSEFRRGTLIRSFVNLERTIKSNEELSCYFDHFLTNKSEFNGCNLVYMNILNCCAQYAATHYEGMQPVELEDQKVYSVTNNSLNEPSWPKQDEGINILQNVINDINQNKSTHEIDELKPQLLELLLTIGRINKIYKDESNESSQSSIFVEPGYWKDVRFLTNSTLSTTALVVYDCENGLKGTMIERTYDLSNKQDHIEIGHKAVEDWIGDELKQHLSMFKFSTSSFEF